MHWGKIGVGIFLVFIFFAVIGIPLWYIHAAGSVVTAPARVLTRTMDTDHIIDSYEDFRDTYQAYNARVAQIKEFGKQIPADADDKKQLRTELSGQRQSCRELVARYNSNSSKANHNIFKLGGGSLPNELDMEECNT
jgi:hypothetical protein